MNIGSIVSGLLFERYLTYSFFAVEDRVPSPCKFTDIATLPYCGGSNSSPPYTETDCISGNLCLKRIS